MTWWFVVHTQEDILSKLDAEWKKVKVQTGWTLQHCYMPAAGTNQPPSGSTLNSFPPSSNFTLPCIEPLKADAIVTLEMQESPLQRDELTAVTSPDSAKLPSTGSSASPADLIHESKNESSTHFLDPVSPHSPQPQQTHVLQTPK